MHVDVGGIGCNHAVVMVKQAIDYHGIGLSAALQEIDFAVINSASIKNHAPCPGCKLVTPIAHGVQAVGFIKTLKNQGMCPRHVVTVKIYHFQ